MKPKCRHKVWTSSNSTNKSSTRVVWRIPCANSAKYDPDENGNLTACGVHSAAAQNRRQVKQAKKALIDYQEMRKIGVKRGIDLSAIDALIADTIEIIETA